MLVENIHLNFYNAVREIEREVADVAGWLSPRDIRFLAMVAAHPCAQGEILEIGAYRGKSSIVLAKAAQLAGQTKIYSCDPLVCDVPPTHPFYPYVETVAQRNVAGGYPCGGVGEPCDSQNRPYFRPYAPTTRAQLAKMLFQAYVLQAGIGRPR